MFLLGSGIVHLGSVIEWIKMLRISAGKYKGRRLRTPASIRPTTQRVRECVFDILGVWIEDKTVLELFAGSGAVGLEALSRGAREVTFVEQDARHIDIIKHNVAQCCVLGGKLPARYMKRSAEAALAQLGRSRKSFDLIFLDPPYGRDLGKKCLPLINKYDILNQFGFVICETAQEDILPEVVNNTLTIYDKRSYGETVLAFYRRQEQ